MCIEPALIAIMLRLSIAARVACTLPDATPAQARTLRLLPRS
jgi:hypothetical protein